MKPLAAAILLSSVLFSCSAEASDTNEVRGLLAGLTNPPAWMGDGSPTVTGSKLEKLKHLAIPMLLEKVSSLNHLNYADPKKYCAEVEKIGLACALLGTNARPVLGEVAKCLASKDPEKRSASWLIFQVAGPISLQPLIEFEMSGIQSPEPVLIKRYILEVTEEFAADYVPELVRIYFRTERSQAIQKYITLTFREALTCEHSQELIPILKTILAGQDEFLVLESLAFVKRCDSLVPRLKDDLSRILTSPNPRIQLEAAKLVPSP